MHGLTVPISQEPMHVHATWVTQEMGPFVRQSIFAQKRLMEDAINMLIASIYTKGRNVLVKKASQEIINSVMILMNVWFQMEAVVAMPRVLILWVRDLLTYYIGYYVFTEDN